MALRWWFLLIALAAGAMAAEKSLYLYIGTYTGPASKGIYLFRFNPASGKTEPLGVAAETPNPSFLALHPGGRFLYAVNETGDYQGQRSGSVSSFSIDRATGKLTPLNTVASKGTSPCAITVDKTGRTVLVANYSSGSLAAFPVGPDGKLGEASFVDQREGHSVDPRQRGPHAHSANITPDNRLVLSADLGLDQVFIYHLNAASATLSPNSPPSAKLSPGSGPRHVALHPNHKLLYVINEIKSTITAFHWDGKTGSATEIETVSTIPSGFTGQNSTAEIAVHPNGRFLFGSNRGADDIAVFAIDRTTGKLKLAGHYPTKGKTPRNFAIDPSGRWLLAANQDSGNITVFRIDGKTGALQESGSIEAPSPVCVLFHRIR